MRLLHKLFSPKKETRSTNDCEMEVCVCCGATTSIPVCEPVENRLNFVSGCGQLCPKCYAKLCGITLDGEDSRMVTAVFEKTGKQ